MCCGVSGAGDYTSTAWQRDLGEESNSLQLPLTCCALNNTHTVDSFLDHQPKDLRKCQDLESYEEGYRYSQVKVLNFSVQHCVSHHFRAVIHILSSLQDQIAFCWSAFVWGQVCWHLLGYQYLATFSNKIINK